LFWLPGMVFPRSAGSIPRSPERQLGKTLETETLVAVRSLPAKARASGCAELSMVPILVW